MVHPCPTCGKELDTKSGMRKHHTKVHGEPLANRVCKGCGTEFYDDKARLEFCDDCNSEAGEHNGNWSNARERTVCESCEKSFEYYPSNKDGLYCSECVVEEGTFEGAPHWRRAERVERNCEYCGREQVVLKSDVERGLHRFCSRSCLSAWMSENWQKEDHPVWKGGKVDYLGRWNSVREEALERDGHRCCRCGKTKEEIGREPDVHHIIPVRRFEEQQDAHRLLNLVSLCRSCHNVVESQTEVSDS